MLSATVTAPARIKLEQLSGRSANGQRLLDFDVRPEGYWQPVRSHITVMPQRVDGSISSGEPTEWDIEPRLDSIVEVILKARERGEASGQHGGVVVFVGRRSHAEQVAEQLAVRDLARVEFFHAGLDSDDRQDRFERFRDGQIDVLVATKAFGMGIDIPDIHWAVHLSPPTFLEDFLQEVGRMGRGEEERRRAGLESLEARLLYSEADFETNHTNIQRSRIDFPKILRLWEQIRENAKLVDDSAIAIMPEEGFERLGNPSDRRAAVTTVKKCLFWLEQMGRVRLLATRPNFLEVTIRPVVLRRVAEEETGASSDVANCLLPLVGDRHPGFDQIARPHEPESADRIFSGLAALIGRIVGFVLSGPKAAPGPDGPIVDRGLNGEEDDADCEAVLDLGYIYKSTSLVSVDEVLEGISGLVRQGALRIRRRLEFKQGKLGDRGDPEIDQMFSRAEEASVALIRLTEGRRNVDYDDIDLPEFSVGHFITAELDDSFEIGNCLRTTALLAVRIAGVRVRHGLDEDGRLKNWASLPRGKGGPCIGRTKDLFRLARQLWQLILPALSEKEQAVDLAALIEQSLSVHHRVRVSDVGQALRILNRLKLASTAAPLLPVSHVVGLKEVDRELREDDAPEVLRELADVNQLAEHRGQAMDVFTHLPAEARDVFIEGYFERETPQELEELLIEQVRQVEDDDGTGWVATKLAQIRAEEIENHFSRFDKPDAAEPCQWAAISHPFNRSLMVNAGPGAGKTEVLVARLVHLIHRQRVPPDNIMVLAFNRAVVFEIRARIKKLFSLLGYAGYIRRLRVSTFHSLAFRYLEGSGRARSEDEEGPAIYSEMDERFARELKDNPNFADRVASGVQVILVDEFQDVNDDIFAILECLRQASNATITAIGDDDQDILSWRRQGGNSSVKYFEMFPSIFDAQDARVDLSANFRSNGEIIDTSQMVIDHVIDSHRIKRGVVLTPSEPGRGGEVVTLSDDPDLARERILERTNQWIAEAIDRQQSIAILCRTNDEVAEVYDRLRASFPQLLIQNSTVYRILDLRHVGAWFDLVRKVAPAENALLDDKLRQEVEAEWARCRVLEARLPERHPIDVWSLWEYCLAERSFPRVRHLERFLRDLSTDDYDRIHRIEGHPVIVSTIHRVKGLEFDRVVIVPSVASYPFHTDRREPNLQDRCDEARLFYVGMTRARSYLLYARGARENAWAVKEGGPREGITRARKVFTGKNEESRFYFINFSARSDEDQAYIERNVAVGDQILLQGLSGLEIGHADGSVSRTIGRFTQHAFNFTIQKYDLRVAAVRRYPQDLDGEYASRLCPIVRQRGWSLFVLLEGWIQP